MQCKAHRRDGQQCGNAPIKGATVCRMHGGSIPAVRAKAAQRVAEGKAVSAMKLFAAPVDIDPANALLELVHSAAGEVAYWHGEVSRVAEKSPGALTWGVTKAEQGIGPQGPVDTETSAAEPHVAYRMWVSAQDRLAKYATAALKAGVQERQIRLAEQEGALVAQVIRRILDRLDLSEWQAEMVGSVVPEELRALSQAV